MYTKCVPRIPLCARFLGQVWYRVPSSSSMSASEVVDLDVQSRVSTAFTRPNSVISLVIFFFFSKISYRSIIFFAFFRSQRTRANPSCVIDRSPRVLFSTNNWTHNIIIEVILCSVIFSPASRTRTRRLRDTTCRHNNTVIVSDKLVRIICCIRANKSKAGIRVSAWKVKVKYLIEKPRMLQILPI